ncbi:flagellar biosynthetic protein FliR [Aminipila butyrica]|uniref:Flagellar biosynthetic protein FliR n=1 Tax=Aminipila butyrica TaxID=433296 RepID=A0A858BTG1_9FIRM|nr:flagellar biosynthetic protein FliR [Aminipila butyrica]QIB68385.1 flagellar biosynthetic protein FliR [Aminipila butyrica]
MQSFLAINNLTVFGLILMRMVGCIALNPILGRKNVPPMMKAGISLMLAILVFSYTDISTIEVIDSTVEYIVIGVKELVVGFVVGFAVSLFTYVIILGGEVIDMQMGLSMSKVYDPASNVSLSLNATFYNILFIFMFFHVQGHLTLFKLFLELSKAVPYGQTLFGEDLATGMISVFCQCTILGIKLAMPMIALQFFVEMAFGILMRNIPQINVIMINIQAKIFAGLVFLLILFTPTLSFVESLIDQLFSAIVQLAKLMG